METSNSQRQCTGWLESSGLDHLLQIPKRALRLDNLGLGLASIVLTVMLGTVLDWAWKLRGGIAANAITHFSFTHQAGQPYVEPVGELGIFQVWREHQRQCILGLLGSSVPGKSLAAGTELGKYVESYSTARPLAKAVECGYGTWWLIQQHYVYAVLFCAGLLIIWSWGGGAICRIAATHVARGEYLSLRDAAGFARRRLWGGFLMAPCVPLGLIFITVVFLVLGGLLLWIPLIGDLIGGGAFFLALFGGAVIAALLVGLFTAGHLFWPAVAAEGCDGFDAFSRGFSYVFSKPWRAIAYGVFALIYTAICWLAAYWFVYLAFSITRAVVSFGTAPFGWGRRVVGEQSLSKLETLWPLAGPDALCGLPQWQALGWFEYLSALLITLWVWLAVAALWGFLASLYYCSCTSAYFLLRRDVDGTDLGDLCADEEVVEPMTASAGFVTTPQTTTPDEAPSS